MKLPWLHRLVSVMVAVVVVIGASSLDASTDDDAFTRERGDCASGVCGRNFNDAISKIAERNDLAGLTNSYQEEDGLQNRQRCMDWACRLRRRLHIDGMDDSYDKDDHDNGNGLEHNVDDVTIEDKRFTRKNDRLPSNDDGMSERKRTSKNYNKSRKRCLAWFCNDVGKRAAKSVEKKREIKSDEKHCMAWNCLGKRLKERINFINNPDKRKVVENLDLMTAKRSSTSNVLKKQRDGSLKSCLSWDCKRATVLRDSTSQRREVTADRGFRGFLMKRNLAGVDVVSTMAITVHAFCCST